MKNLARKQNTVIDGMVLVPGAGTINHCTLLVMNAYWEPISLIPCEKIKKVQKSFENELPEIQ
ncbi:hypothetical protein G9A89_013124 [Geosiphon pyriformis]|nr:hypothetical protein G9A89_013124 [Geosiphon pyriformis]